MNSSATASTGALAPSVRWLWLSNAKADVLWNLAPFWLGYAMIAVLWAVRGYGDPAHNTVLNFTFGGRAFHIGMWAFVLYGPLVDAPHLGATIARTYVDREEWATRRSLFLGSLVWFLVGPAMILLPYAIAEITPLSEGAKSLGWIVWGHFLTGYALFHINKQHWGFVALYKRKNDDLANALENRIDQWFFYTSIWLPVAAMMTAPWFIAPDGAPIAWTHATIGSTTVGGILNPLFRIAFWVACAAYAVFQAHRFRQGARRNGPKLLYLATIIPLQYVGFAMDQFVAAFWVITTGLGHCMQYHRVVWTYGERKYLSGPETANSSSIPRRLFSNVWLYIAFGVGFGLLTLQGPTGSHVAGVAARWLDAQVLQRLFAFVDELEGAELALKVAAAFISGVRLHHFYVDSKIWRVSKNQALAKNLNV